MTRRSIAKRLIFWMFVLVGAAVLCAGPAMAAVTTQVKITNLFHPEKDTVAPGDYVRFHLKFNIGRDSFPPEDPPPWAVVATGRAEADEFADTYWQTEKFSSTGSLVYAGEDEWTWDDQIPTVAEMGSGAKVWIKLTIYDSPGGNVLYDVTTEKSFDIEPAALTVDDVWVTNLNDAEKPKFQKGTHNIRYHIRFTITADGGPYAVKFVGTVKAKDEEGPVWKTAWQDQMLRVYPGTHEWAWDPDDEAPYPGAFPAIAIPDDDDLIGLKAKVLIKAKWFECANPDDDPLENCELDLLDADTGKATFKIVAPPL